MLTIRLPKSAERSNVRQIPVSTEQRGQQTGQQTGTAQQTGQPTKERAA